LTKKPKPRFEMMLNEGDHGYILTPAGTIKITVKDGKNEIEDGPRS